MYLQKYLHYVKMLIKGTPSFDWDKGNIKKIEIHGLEKSEVKDFFRSHVYVSHDFKHSDSEERFAAIGQSSNEKYMVIFLL